MKHLSSFNEGFFDRFKKKVVQKSDLYISKINTKEEVNDPSDSKKFYGYKFMDLELAKSKYDDASSLNLGIFIKQDDYFEPLKFSKYFNSGNIWYDYGDVFDRLRKINTELGFNLNSEVYVTPLEKNLKITEIMNGCLYFIKNSAFDKSIDYRFTLFFKVEGCNQFFQIEHLELVKDKQSLNLIDETIKSNFFDLIDEDKIEFTSQTFSKKNNEFYLITITSVGKIDTKILKEVSDCLENTRNHFDISEGLNVVMKDISTTHESKLKVEFFIYSK